MIKSRNVFFGFDHQYVIIMVHEFPESFLFGTGRRSANIGVPSTTARPFVLPKQELTRLRTQNHWVGIIPELHTPSHVGILPRSAYPTGQSQCHAKHITCFWGTTGQSGGRGQGRKEKTTLLRLSGSSDQAVRPQLTTPRGCVMRFMG